MEVLNAAVGCWRRGLEVTPGLHDFVLDKSAYNLDPERIRTKNFRIDLMSNCQQVDAQSRTGSASFMKLSPLFREPD